MSWIGVDLHRKTSRLVVLDQEGSVVEKHTIPSRPEAWRDFFGRFPAGSTHVTMEATIGWYWAADVLEELGLDVHLAHPLKVRLIAESTVKTDTVDAAALAQLTRMGWLPESRITPAPMRRLRERLRLRIALVSTRTAAKCRVHALLDKVGLALPEVTDLFGATGRAWLNGLVLPEGYQENLATLLRLIDYLGEEIKGIERWLARRTRQDGQVRLLMTIPGIGRFGASLILAEIGDIGLFAKKEKLASFIGVVPGADNSAQRVRATGLKKDSNRYLRWLLAEACTKAVRVVPAWGRLYERVHRGQATRVGPARGAVMHKMACAIWRVLTTREGFDRLHNCPEHERETASSH